MEIVFTTAKRMTRLVRVRNAPVPERDYRKLFTAGAWHRIELYANVGTVDQYDGIVKMWVDGTLVTSYTNLKFLDSRYSSPRDSTRAVGPVWGGVGGTKTRDDFLDMDHFYVSGRQ